MAEISCEVTHLFLKLVLNVKALEDKPKNKFVRNSRLNHE